MTDLDHHIAYLKARIREFETRPDLNRDQLREYKKYLAMATESPAGYEKDAGDMFSTMKSQETDRYRSRAEMYKKLNLMEDEEGARLLLEAAASSTGYGDIYVKLEKANDAARDLNKKRNMKIDRLMELMGAIIMMKTAIPKDLTEKKALVREKWKTLKELVPDISWEVLSSSREYRQWLYYDDERMAVLGTWLREAL